MKKLFIAMMMVGMIIFSSTNTSYAEEKSDDYYYWVDVHSIYKESPVTKDFQVLVYYCENKEYKRTLLYSFKYTGKWTVLKEDKDGKAKYVEVKDRDDRDILDACRAYMGYDI